MKAEKDKKKLKEAMGRNDPTLPLPSDKKNPTPKQQEESSEEESDSDEDEDSDEEGIGRGFDDDDEIDLTEITEQDVLEKKLQILEKELKESYKVAGATSGAEASKLIEMKTIRLTFLDVGPQVENLEFFENLESLFLNNNVFETIGQYAFQFNHNI